MQERQCSQRQSTANAVQERISHAANLLYIWVLQVATLLEIGGQGGVQAKSDCWLDRQVVRDYGTRNDCAT